MGGEKGEGMIERRRENGRVKEEGRRGRREVKEKG